MHAFTPLRTLLLTKDLIPKTHSGTITLLHEHFVLKGKFDSHHSSFFSHLMKQRADNDYSDFLIRNDDEVIDFIEPAKNYVAYIEELINSQSYSKPST